MRPYQHVITLWTSMPGICEVTAWSLVAEIGTNPEQFPQASNLDSWAGICPDDNESAGKRKSGKTRKGNRWLRPALNQAAWGAARTKNTYFAARFHRLAAKRESKRAIVAIGHKIFVLAHYLLQHNCPFRELGADYYQRLVPQASPNPLSVVCNALGTRLRSHLLSRRSEYFRESLLVGLSTTTLRGFKRYGWFPQLGINRSSARCRRFASVLWTLKTRKIT
jgi:hypothetical protein